MCAHHFLLFLPLDLPAEAFFPDDFLGVAAFLAIGLVFFSAFLAAAFLGLAALGLAALTALGLAALAALAGFAAFAGLAGDAAGAGGATTGAGAGAGAGAAGAGVLALGVGLVLVGLAALALGVCLDYVIMMSYSRSLSCFCHFNDYRGRSIFSSFIIPKNTKCNLIGYIKGGSDWWAGRCLWVFLLRIWLVGETGVLPFGCVF